MIKQKGFSLVELILVIAIFGVLVGGLGRAVIISAGQAQAGGQRARALAMADEGLEAVRSIRNEAWSNLVAGQHGLAIAGGKWTFNSTSDVTDIFSRQITLTSLDANTIEALSHVSWVQVPYQITSVDIVTRFYKWAGSVVSWATPGQEASLNLSGNSGGTQVVTSGNYAYIIRNSGNPNLSVVDISNPAIPSQVASLNLSNGPRNIFLSGNYLYIASTSNTQELQIINITTPTAPTQAGSYNAPGNDDYLGVYVVGTTAYIARNVAGGQAEFVILNVSNPASITQVGILELGIRPTEVWVSGNYAYLSTYSDTQELMVIDISTPAAPSLVGSLGLAGTADGYTIDGFGSTVVLGRSDGSLHTIDVSNPLSPSLLGTYSAGGAINDLTVGYSNQYAFLTTANVTSDFQVIDISAPASPVLFGSYNGAVTYSGVAYSSSLDRACIASSDTASEFLIMQPQ